MCTTSIDRTLAARLTTSWIVIRYVGCLGRDLQMRKPSYYVLCVVQEGRRETRYKFWKGCARVAEVLKRAVVLDSWESERDGERDPGLINLVWWT